MAGMDDVPKDLLKQAYQRKPIYLLKVPLLFGMWGGCLALLYAMQDHALFVPVGIACTLLITNIIRGLGAVAHDSVHGTCFRSKAASYWLALLCWSPTGMAVTIYANYHLHHHRIANTYPDVDNFVVTDYTRNPVLAKLLLLLVYSFGYPIYFMFQMFRYVPRLSTFHKIRMHVELAGIFSLIAAAAYFMPLGVFLFFYGIPFILSAGLASVTSMIEHYEMLPGEDAYSSRTYGTHAYITNFIWNNVSFHNEHHKFPGIPFYNLRWFHENAFPHYDKRVQSACFTNIWPLAFSLYGRILKLDISKLDARYAKTDRVIEKTESIKMDGIEPGYLGAVPEHSPQLAGSHLQPHGDLSAAAE